MKKWLPALVLLAAAMVYLGAIFFPITGLPHSRAESLQWDEGHRQMTAEESEALDERLAGVKFNIRASGSTTLYMEHITVFFDDRKAQTILYCMEDGTLWLTVCRLGRHVHKARAQAGFAAQLGEAIGHVVAKVHPRRALHGQRRIRRGGGQSLVFCSMRCSSSVWRSISLWISLSVSRILFRMSSSMMVPPLVFSFMIP